MSLADRVIDGAAEAVMITDADNRIVRVNPAFERITGYTAAEAIGAGPSLLSSGKQGRRFYEDLWFALRNRGEWQGEIWNKRKSGEIYPEWVSISVLRNDEGVVTHHVAFFSDITLQKEGEARLVRLAHYDTLTGLPNRLVLRDRLGLAMAAATRTGKHVGVLMIDLDRFKPVNDVLGHAAGDAVLVGVASRMKSVMRADSTICRQGGDEFVVIAPDLGHPSELTTLIDRLGSAISAPYSIGGTPVTIGASIGSAIYPDCGMSVDDLIECADAAMYATKRKRAKERGGSTTAPGIVELRRIA